MASSLSSSTDPLILQTALKGNKMYGWLQHPHKYAVYETLVFEQLLSQCKTWGPEIAKGLALLPDRFQKTEFYLKELNSKVDKWNEDTGRHHAFTTVAVHHFVNCLKVHRRYDPDIDDVADARRRIPGTRLWSATGPLPSESSAKVAMMSMHQESRTSHLMWGPGKCRAMPLTVSKFKSQKLSKEHPPNQERSGPENGVQKQCWKNCPASTCEALREMSKATRKL